MDTCRRVIAVGLIWGGLGELMATIDSIIVNISLPTLVTVFQTSFAAANGWCSVTFW
jgi:hypothetical protein